MGQCVSTLIFAHCLNSVLVVKSPQGEYDVIWQMTHIYALWTLVLEKTLESPLGCMEIKPVNPKGNQSWIYIGRTDAEAEASILWPPVAKSQTIGKDPWSWETLKAGGKGDNRGWDGWMASLTRCTYVWVISASWGWTGKPGVLQSTETQRGKHDWATELTDWLLVHSRILLNFNSINAFYSQTLR